MKRIGWFTTARGPGSFNLFNTMMERMDKGEIDAEISFMFINRDVKDNKNRKRMIDMAEAAEIPVVIFPSDSFRPELKAKDTDAWRDAYGEALRHRISRYDMDFGVLAGYMLIFDPETCRKFTLINLHPALPDTYKGTWEEIVGQVVDHGDGSYGATVHLCTPELDRGRAISYDSFPLDKFRSRIPSREDLVKAIRAEEVRRESHLLMETIKMIVNGEVVLRDGKVLHRSGKRLSHSIGMAALIDGRLAR
jgi:phosphoribosylglycinamide formyltransferase-1